MVNQELVGYIRRRMRGAYFSYSTAEKDIERELIKTGWDKSVIKDAFSHVEEDNKRIIDKMKYPFFVPLLTLFVFLTYVWLFYKRITPEVIAVIIVLMAIMDVVSYLTFLRKFGFTHRRSHESYGPDQRESQ